MCLMLVGGGGNAAEVGSFHGHLIYIEIIFLKIFITVYDILLS